MGGQTDEHTGVGVRQSRWRGARMLHRPPCRLQQEPMLRVHPHTSRADIPKNGASNTVTSSTKPARRVTILPGASGSGSKNSSAFHRSRGTSDTASRPSRSTRQNSFALARTRKTHRVADNRKTRCPRHRIFDECHAVVLSTPTGEDSMPTARAASTPWSPRPRLKPLTANTPGPDHLAELPRCSAAIDRRGKFNMSGRLRSRNTSDGKYDKVPGLRGATSRNYRRVSLLARVGRRAVHRHHYRRAGERR